MMSVIKNNVKPFLAFLALLGIGFIGLEAACPCERGGVA
jgi:hypothetical protein